jgi:hypothetical protein
MKFQQLGLILTLVVLLAAIVSVNIYDAHVIYRIITGTATRDDYIYSLMSLLIE